MNNKLLTAGLILFLTLLFRGVDFGKTPAGVNHDEASQGYNAYSLLLTGRDEYGKFLPVLNRSFGTYASNLYTYMTILPVKLFGLNAFSTRATSLVSGLIITTLVVIALGQEAGFVVAISPVFVFYSRAAFETNLGLALLFLGIVLAAKKKLPLSFLTLSLSAYAYHVERILSVILIVFVSVHFWKERKKTVIFSLLLALIIQIPLLVVSFTPGANSRAASQTGQGNYPFLFLSYFSPNNLFNRPDPGPNKSFPELGTFYWWMIIPFILGLRKFILEKEYKTLVGQLLLIVLLASPAIAATTSDYFSTWRALPMFMPLAWIISKGLGKRKTVYILIILVALFELYSNLVLLKHERSISWGYHYQALAAFVKNHPGETIVIDNARSYPIYIWLAFYNRYDPRKFQSSINPQ